MALISINSVVRPFFDLFCRLCWQTKKHGLFTKKPKLQACILILTAKFVSFHNVLIEMSLLNSYEIAELFFFTFLAYSSCFCLSIVRTQYEEQK